MNEWGWAVYTKGSCVGRCGDTTASSESRATRTRSIYAAWTRNRLLSNKSDASTHLHQGASKDRPYQAAPRNRITDALTRKKHTTQKQAWKGNTEYALRETEGYRYQLHLTLRRKSATPQAPNRKMCIGPRTSQNL